MNWLEQQDSYKKDCQVIQDAFNAQNKCGEYLGVQFAESQEDINTIINSSAPQQQKQGWSQPRSTNQGRYQGNYYNSTNSRQPPLRDLILEQARINDNIAKRLTFNDKILESINTKMDSFSSAVKE
jgi:hypothetical protein